MLYRCWKTENGMWRVYCVVTGETYHFLSFEGAQFFMAEMVDYYESWKNETR